MDLTRDLLENYRIQNTVISAYHPQTAGLVERGHAPIVNSLAKYCQHSPSSWPKHLSLALWADRISVRRSTGYSAFRLVYGRDCVMPVELSLPTWSLSDWERLRTREEMLEARMMQMDRQVLEREM